MTEQNGIRNRKSAGFTVMVFIAAGIFALAGAFSLSGCGKQAQTETPPQSVISFEGVKILLPEGWKMSVKTGMVDIFPAHPHCHVQLFALAEGVSMEDAVSGAAASITSEVVDFKAAETNDLPLACGTGKHIIGTGTEADDNDPSKVEVFLFKPGSRIYLLCAHTGEDDPALQRQDLITFLNGAEAKK